MKILNNKVKYCLIGKGGCAREFACQVFMFHNDIDIIGYIDKEKSNDIEVNNHIIKYLGDDFYLQNNTVIPLLTIGDVKVRREYIKNVADYKKFKNVFIDGSSISNDSKFGANGNIVSANCFISTNTIFGNFNFINIGVTICHDCNIGDNVVISPNVNIAGNVSIGNDVFIGIGATIMNGVKIGSNVTIGAGAVVIKNVDDNKIVVGVPARVIR